MIYVEKSQVTPDNVDVDVDVYLTIFFALGSAPGM